MALRYLSSALRRAPEPHDHERPLADDTSEVRRSLALDDMMDHTIHAISAASS